jgi:hypothetical protein
MSKHTMIRAGACALGLLLVAPALTQAAAPLALTFTVPPAVAGGPVHLSSTKHYADGSVTYTYRGTISAHPTARLVYLVNANNPSAGAARTTSAQAFAVMRKGLLGGAVRAYHSGALWATVERTEAGGLESMGGAANRTALVVVVAQRGTRCGWIPMYLGHITTTLIQRAAAAG